MKAKLTCFMLPAVLSFMENEILKETGLTKTVYHRQMIQYFFKNNGELSPDIFRIPEKGEAVVKEQIYLSREEEDQILQYIETYEASHFNKCSMTKILTQALVSYSVQTVKRMLNNGEIDNIGISTGILYIINENLMP